MLPNRPTDDAILHPKDAFEKRKIKRVFSLSDPCGSLIHASNRADLALVVVAGRRGAEGRGRGTGEALRPGRRERKVGGPGRREWKTARRGEGQATGRHRGSRTASSSTRDGRSTGHSGHREGRRNAHVGGAGDGRGTGSTRGARETERRGARHAGEGRGRHTAGKVEWRRDSTRRREGRTVQAGADATGGVLGEHGVGVGLSLGRVRRSD